MAIDLNHKLAADCHLLGHSGTSLLLLNRNALFAWFVLVPETDETEFYRLTQTQQLDMLAQVNRLSRFIEDHFRVDKLNIATIGNVVSQMHVHVIGRHRADPCWPGVVWGTDKFEEYTPERVAEIKAKLHEEQLCTM